jgi:hypothetical protein
VERPDGIGINAQEWCQRFCELYDASASSLLTELGLFYDRHRKFVEYGQRSDRGNPEYTDDEWNRVMESLLGQFAGDMGLVQTPDPGGRQQFEWFLPGVSDRPTVVIRAASAATNTILSQDLVDLSRTGAHLSVFVMYPDYPPPEGSTTIGGATRAWKSRIEKRLEELRPERELLALMISAYSFDVPAPWQGFVWDPATRSFEAAQARPSS